MAKVMADQKGWVDAEGKPEEIPFVVNETFVRLRESVNDGSSAYFVRLHYILLRPPIASA